MGFQHGIAQVFRPVLSNFGGAPGHSSNRARRKCSFCQGVDPEFFTVCQPGSVFDLGFAGTSRQQSFTKKIDQGLDMLVLSRKKDEKIVIGDNITLMVIEIRGDKVRLGIEAPRDVTVHREEVYEAIRRETTPDQKA